jgi:hypothetical protein
MSVFEGDITTVEGLREALRRLLAEYPQAEDFRYVIVPGPAWALIPSTSMVSSPEGTVSVDWREIIDPDYEGNTDALIQDEIDYVIDRLEDKIRRTTVNYWEAKNGRRDVKKEARERKKAEGRAYLKLASGEPTGNGHKYTSPAT